MVDLVRDLKKLMHGRAKADGKTLRAYSHDASLFEVMPKVVVFPRSVADLKYLVSYVNEHKKSQPGLSLTARSGGTDMSGGAVNDSIIIDFTKYFKEIGRVSDYHAQAQPGVYYRKFEKVTLQHHQIMPAYPASREICTIGGMVANNAGGEKSLTYGKTEDYVAELKAVLADGNEYTLKPLTKTELEAKMAQKNFEGEVYSRAYKLIKKHEELIREAKPKVHKNSTGYNLWDVWDGKNFDLTKLFVGSQGTLGLVTDIKFRLVDAKPASSLVVIFMPSLDNLAQIIKSVLKFKPTSFESFDDHTFSLALRFLPYFRKNLGWWGVIKLAFSFLPDVLKFIGGLPKLTLLVEFEGDSKSEVNHKADQLRGSLKSFDVKIEEATSAAKARKYWLMRRESFNLLRHKVKDKHAAPFIDDLIVPPEHLTEFLPKLTAILNRSNLTYTVAGHMGEGNFHIIPLMDLTDRRERAKIPVLMKEVNDLVLGYGGSLSGEHNDGLIRGPFLKEMYGAQMEEVFQDVKKIFDPRNIFNPHKKVDATWHYSATHIRQRF